MMSMAVGYSRLAVVAVPAISSHSLSPPNAFFSHHPPPPPPPPISFTTRPRPRPMTTTSLRRSSPPSLPACHVTNSHPHRHPSSSQPETHEIICKDEEEEFLPPSSASHPLKKRLHSLYEYRDTKESLWKYERLFSNLNEATRKHQPGDIGSAILLIAGTTVGAGILALPAVTQDAGFLPSSLACLGCWLYMVATGLLVAEVNINTMCELGSGGVSIVSMALRTLGDRGFQIACGAYLFIHYALLVAYVARSADIVSNALGTPLWMSATLFTGAFGGLCYFGSQRVIGAVNGALVLAVVATFMALVSVAAGELQLNALLQANFAAVPKTVPVIALAFVYQNVVPVICTDLEGDLPKIRYGFVAAPKLLKATERVVQIRY